MLPLAIILQLAAAQVDRPVVLASLTTTRAGRYPVVAAPPNPNGQFAFNNAANSGLLCHIR